MKEDPSPGGSPEVRQVNEIGLFSDCTPTVELPSKTCFHGIAYLATWLQTGSPILSGGILLLPVFFSSIKTIFDAGFCFYYLLFYCYDLLFVFLMMINDLEIPLGMKSGRGQF